MGGRLLAGALAMSTVVLASPGWAGASGGFHGGSFRMPAGHPMMGAPRGFGGGAWRGGARPMPPIAGVIHERAGTRPFFSAYGHVNTGPGAWGTGARYGAPSHAAGYGHVAAAVRGDGFGRDRRWRYGGDRWDRERFADGRRPAVYRFGRRYGGGYASGGYDGSGGYGDVGSYGSPGSTYGSPGTYGTPGAYGGEGTYGRYGTEAGSAGAYLSEPPLAATRTEAPLAPSPYGADGGYYAPRRSAVSPHILTVDRAAGCGCGSSDSAYPVIYRYGVGTAY